MSVCHPTSTCIEVDYYHFFKNTPPFSSAHAVTHVQLKTIRHVCQSGSKSILTFIAKFLRLLSQFVSDQQSIVFSPLHFSQTHPMTSNSGLIKKRKSKTQRCCDNISCRRNRIRSSSACSQRLHYEPCDLAAEPKIKQNKTKKRKP